MLICVSFKDAKSVVELKFTVEDLVGLVASRISAVLPQHSVCLGAYVGTN